MTRRHVDPRQIVGVLAAESRLRLWASIVVAEVVDGDAMPLVTLSASQKRDLRALEAAGVVRVDAGLLRHESTVMKDALAEFSKVKPSEDGPGKFFVDGFLESTPRRARDREEVLSHLVVRLFPVPGLVLSERDVMDRLGSLVRDPVGVRRALVDHGFVERERDGARYWRADRGTAPAATRRE